MPSAVVRIAPAEMLGQFMKILTGLGLPSPKASVMARIFMENSLDGVYSHGVNRFSKFVQFIRNGPINVSGEPECAHSNGAVEQWDGHSGFGVLNALRGSERAMEVAGIHGIGCVAMSHTNHWMRGGTYGWQVAREGFAFIAWSNTMSNMPPWGAADPRLGNNPLVIAVPYQNEAIVLDMAMSQFSFGALEQKKMRKEPLPVPGGYNRQGDLSYDAAEILETQRVLPAGFWKGAGLSLLLDILGTILSGGLSVKRVSDQGVETNVSQVFIAIALDKLKNSAGIKTALEEIISDYHRAYGVGQRGVYPGERVLQTRKENQLNGIPVVETIWSEIMSMA